jgi:hypothetical protein
MKYLPFAILATVAALSIGCNKEKAAIDESSDARQDAIDIQKEEVTADAKYATEQTDTNAEIDKANIEANKQIIQAQLDADKKRIEAEAEAAKATLDAEQ